MYLIVCIICILLCLRYIIHNLSYNSFVVNNSGTTILVLHECWHYYGIFIIELAMYKICFRAYAKMAASSNQYVGGGTKTVGMFSKLVSQGSSFVMEGVKNLVVKRHVSNIFCLWKYGNHYCIYTRVHAHIHSVPPPRS